MTAKDRVCPCRDTVTMTSLMALFRFFLEHTVKTEIIRNRAKTLELPLLVRSVEFFLFPSLK